MERGTAKKGETTIGPGESTKLSEESRVVLLIDVFVVSCCQSQTSGECCCIDENPLFEIAGFAVPGGG